MSAPIARRILLSSVSSPFKSATPAGSNSTSKTIEGWKAWYADGSVYDSVNTQWQELPREGIIGVVVYYEQPYRDLVYGGDWYYLDDGEPACTETAEWGEWVEPPEVPPDELKRSGTVEDFDSILDEMMENDEWP